MLNDKLNGLFAILVKRELYRLDANTYMTFSNEASKNKANFIGGALAFKELVEEMLEDYKKELLTQEKETCTYDEMKRFSGFYGETAYMCSKCFHVYWKREIDSKPLYCSECGRKIANSNSFGVKQSCDDIEDGVYPDEKGGFVSTGWEDGEPMGK